MTTEQLQAKVAELKAKEAIIEMSTLYQSLKVSTKKDREQRKMVKAAMIEVNKPFCIGYFKGRI